MLVVQKDDKAVRFLTDSLETHPDHPKVVVEKLTIQEFNQFFVVSSKDSVDAIAALLKERAANLGVTAQAAEILSIEHTTNLTIQQQKDEAAMATTKAAAKAKAPKAPTKTTNKAGTAKAAVKKAAVDAAAGKAPPPKTTVKAPVAGKGAEASRKPSAASRIRDLIMEGKLTDDKIFETAQKEFGLSDDKRGYVPWYRNDLKKKGMNPPAPKG